MVGYICRLLYAGLTWRAASNSGHCTSRKIVDKLEKVQKIATKARRGLGKYGRPGTDGRMGFFSLEK